MTSRYICKDMESEEVNQATWKVLKKQKGMKNIPYSSVVKVFIVEAKGSKEVNVQVKKNGRAYNERLYVAHDAEK